jgi:nickel-dependent lactate racemase
MNPSEAPLTLPFGHERPELHLPRGKVVARLLPAHIFPAGTAEEIVRGALKRPDESPPLRNLAQGKRSAAILVPGKDCVAAIDVCLPLLLEELNAGGIPDEAIEVFLATGTPQPHSAEDAARLLGREAAARIRWHEHDCRCEEGLCFLGTTSRGTDVQMCEAALNADVVVLVGRIVPHYFAGYSGGRKALLPGVASLHTIQQNHALALDPAGGGLHPAARPCSLDENPVHLDMLEAARMAGPSFILNTMLDGEHCVIGAVAGELEAAHRTGCAGAEPIFKVRLPQPVDAVIASAGGVPYDGNFMQALAAVFNIQEAVRPGGAILWAAECPGGLKSSFLRWGAVPDDDVMERAVRADYDLTGHGSILLRRLIRRNRVALWSTLPDDPVRTLGLEPVHSLEQGLDWLQSVCPGDFRCAVAPCAGIIYATCG